MGSSTELVASAEDADDEVLERLRCRDSGRLVGYPLTEARRTHERIDDVLVGQFPERRRQYYY